MQKSEVVNYLIALGWTDQGLQSSILRWREAWMFAHNLMITNDNAHTIITTLTAMVTGAKL